VRLIVEKLARRCGFDAVEAAMPEGDAKLLTHIRKERAHKAAKRAGAAATEVRRSAVICRWCSCCGVNPS
jgi:ribosomal RNA-processing protein 12